jgi:hypothetical protein
MKEEPGRERARGIREQEETSRNDTEVSCIQKHEPLVWTKKGGGPRHGGR